MSVRQTIEGPEATHALGGALAAALRPGDVLLLHGDLGAGKTTLTQGIAAGLGITEPVNSPTFTLVGEHSVPGAPRGIATLYHLDLYRLNDWTELESIGFDDFLAPADGVTIIEWPERAGGWLPDRALAVSIDYDGPARRVIAIEAQPNGSFDDLLTAVSELATAR